MNTVSALRRFLAILGAMTGLLQAVCGAGDPPRLAVLGFAGSSRNQKVVANAFAEITSGKLTQSGKFEVVKPELTAETMEAGGGLQTLQKAASAADFGKALGCQYVVYGNVLDADVSTSRFSGYGVTTFKTTFGLRVDLKVLNVFNSKIVFSRLLQESEVKVNLNNPDGFSAALFSELSKRAVSGLEKPMLQALEADIRAGADALEKFLVSSPRDPSPSAALEGSPSKAAFRLRFDCAVPTASVEIDGIIEGTCSDSISVFAGLHELTVSARNYQPYKTRIRVTRDMVISVELAPQVTGKK